MTRLAAHRFSWTKRTTAARADAWFEELAHLGPGRVMVTELAGSSAAKVQAHGLSRKEADALQKCHGGTVSEARWLTAENPPQRAPIRIRGRLSVVSTERERAEEEAAGRPPALWVPAGMAFGTGEHATTAMCLRHLADLAGEQDSGAWDFLDLGTGSAILAMAARVLGAGSVLGTDFDATALRVGRENVKANRLAGIQLKRSDVLKWQPERVWEIVAANLFSGVLIEAAGVIAQAVAPGGHLIVSGVLREQEREVLSALAKSGMQRERVTRRGKWISAVLRRPVSAGAGRSKRR
jgi:ribosomal protein L11 methyltransferase